MRPKSTQNASFSASRSLPHAIAVASTLVASSAPAKVDDAATGSGWRGGGLRHTGGLVVTPWAMSKPSPQ